MKPYKISGRGVREPVMNKNTPGVLVAWGAKLKTCTRTNRCFHWHLVELIAEQGFFYERFQLYPSIIVWRSWQSHCWNKRKGKSSSLSLSSSSLSLSSSSLSLSSSSFPLCRVAPRVREIISVRSPLSLTTVEATANSCSSFSTLMNCCHHAIKTGILPIPVQCWQNTYI